MSALTDRIAAVIKDATGVKWYFFSGATPEHVAERIVAAMREDGIVGFVRNDSHVQRRTYTDADAEVWSDR